MSDLYQVEISVTLPAGREQFDGILSHLGEMENRKDALLIKVNNYKELDDFMAVYLEWRDGRYRMELDFPMDDFGWEYPLVLASGLGAKRTRQPVDSGGGRPDATQSTNQRRPHKQRL